MRELVRCPEGEDVYEWLAAYTVDFYNQANVLLGNIMDFCTDSSCTWEVDRWCLVLISLHLSLSLSGDLLPLPPPPPGNTMNAGPKYKYLWADGEVIRKPIKCTAPEYMEYLMNWIQTKMDDPFVFPEEPGVPFGEDFVPTVKSIFKRLFRVYSHIYYNHYKLLEDMGADLYLNISFKQFVFFVEEYDLMDRNEMKPLVLLIDNFHAKEQEKEEERQRQLEQEQEQRYRTRSPQPMPSVSTAAVPSSPQDDYQERRRKVAQLQQQQRSNASPQGDVVSATRMSSKDEFPRHSDYYVTLELEEELEDGANDAHEADILSQVPESVEEVPPPLPEKSPWTASLRLDPTGKKFDSMRSVDLENFLERKADRQSVTGAFVDIQDSWNEDSEVVVLESDDEDEEGDMDGHVQQQQRNPPVPSKNLKVEVQNHLPQAIHLNKNQLRQVESPRDDVPAPPPPISARSRAVVACEQQVASPVDPRIRSPLTLRSQPVVAEDARSVSTGSPMSPRGSSDFVSVASSGAGTGGAGGDSFRSILAKRAQRNGIQEIYTLDDSSAENRADVKLKSFRYDCRSGLSAHPCPPPYRPRAVLLGIGWESDLQVQAFRTAGYEVACVFSDDERVDEWCAARGIPESTCDIGGLVDR